MKPARYYFSHEQVHYENFLVTFARKVAINFRICSGRLIDLHTMKYVHELQIKHTQPSLFKGFSKSEAIPMLQLGVLKDKNLAGAYNMKNALRDIFKQLPHCSPTYLLPPVFSVIGYEKLVRPSMPMPSGNHINNIAMGPISRSI